MQTERNASVYRKVEEKRGNIKARRRRRTTTRTRTRRRRRREEDNVHKRGLPYIYWYKTIPVAKPFHVYWVKLLHHQPQSCERNMTTRVKFQGNQPLYSFMHGYALQLVYTSF